MSADPASTVVTPVLTVTSLRRRHTVAAPSGNAAGSVDADKVMEQLKKTPVNDFYGKGQIRADGRFVHDM